MAELTALQLACIHEYLLAPDDQTMAFKKACAKVGHKVPRVAKQAAHELFSRADVAAEIARRQAARSFRLKFSEDEVLQELRDQMAVTLPDIMSWEGDRITLKDAAQLTEQQRKAIKKLRVKRHSYTDHNDAEHVETTVELELHDRMRVVEDVMKHLGMLTKDENAVNQTINYVLVLNEAPAKTVDEWQKRFSPRLK